MKLSKGTLFGGAIVFQVVIVLMLALFKLSIVTSGSLVLLRVAPVDPRDPFRGDYVTVRYDISSIPSQLFQSQNTLPGNGETVYVSLVQNGSYYSVKDARVTPPATGLYIKGVASGGFGDSVRVKYGIEEYFIPEGTGRTFPFGDHEVIGEVSIDKDGNAVARQLYVDGKRWP